MYKGIAFLYTVCFVLYIIYSREPDYFDGEINIATIHWQKDSLENILIPKAIFIENNTVYAIDARYVFRNLPEQKKVKVIYKTHKPSEAKVYSWWGYWIDWKEIFFSIILLIILFQIAVSINKNPTPQALVEQMEYKKDHKRKYDD